MMLESPMMHQMSAGMARIPAQQAERSMREAQGPSALGSP